MIKRHVIVSDGAADHAASGRRKASWVTIPATDGVPGEPRISTAKVEMWVDTLAEEAEVTPGMGCGPCRPRAGCSRS